MFLMSVSHLDAHIRTSLARSLSLSASREGWMRNPVGFIRRALRRCMARRWSLAERAQVSSRVVCDRVEQEARSVHLALAIHFFLSALSHSSYYSDLG